MKRLFSALVLVAALFAFALFVFASPVHTQSASKKSIEKFVDSVAYAFMFKELSGLDAKRILVGNLRIVIEHSLRADDARDRFEIKSFKTFALAERWLKSREREDGTPIRESRDLLQCRRGLCEYDLDGGIGHNHLYLKKVTYGLRRGRPYIKTIYLLDGD